MTAESCGFFCRLFLLPWRMGPSSRLPLGLLVAVALLLVAPLSPAAALTPDGVLLLGFKYGVVSDPLAVLSSWKYDDETPCNWNGVACVAVAGENGTSRVVSLVLPNARLLGSIAGDLGLIQHLRHLDLSGNSLSGPLPSSLFLRNSSSSAAAAPSELRVLSLAGNEISGSIPELPAGAMGDLQLLNLSDNALTGVLPAGVFSLPNLTVLSLSGNYLSGRLAGGGLPRAEFVDLSSNLINGTLPRDLIAGDSSRLRYLNLSYNKLSGEIPASFAGELPSGAVVDLSFNNLAGEIPDSGPLLYQNPASFEGNMALCGPPLKILCPVLSTPSPKAAAAAAAAAPPATPAAAESPPAFAAIPKTVGGASRSREPGGQRGLKPAAIVGIIAADLGGIALLFVVFFYVYRAKKRRQQQRHQQPQQWAAKSWASPSTASHGGAASEVGRGWRGGFSLLCLGRKRGDQSEGTSTCSDTDTESLEKAEQKKKAAALVAPPQQSGVLVTVDGEAELELETLLKASAYILGARGSSIMYKAVLADGTALAVRRIGETGAAAEKLRDFESQVRAIAKLRHPNLLSIRGFYWGADEKLLIYDYLPNGSLANISYRKMGASPFHLPWENRLRIARGVARGLAYLHEKKYVHGNVKPSNILLRHDMEPLVGDFAVERLVAGGGGGTPSFSARHFGSKRSTLSQNSQPETPAPGGPAASPCLSCGGGAGGGDSAAASPYQAPESLKNLKPSSKWDVYSFGVVLLELIAGRVFSAAELCQWSGGFAAEEGHRVLRMVDPAIRGDVVGDEDNLLSCFRLAFSCAATAPQKRPSMKEASQQLDRSLPLSPLPRHHHHRHDFS